MSGFSINAGVVTIPLPALDVGKWGDGGQHPRFSSGKMDILHERDGKDR